MKRIAVHLFCWFFFFSLIPNSLTAGERIIPELERYIVNGSYAVELNGKVALSKNPQKKYIPASTIKVLTGLMALEILGPDYRFATRFYLDGKKRLFLKGEGDPLLTSESVRTIARKLIDLEITKIDRIILDSSAFSLEGPPQGSRNSHNPYDALSSAVAVNFNAIPFIISKNGTVDSGEPQTPFLPLMEDIAETFSAGRHRVNVSAFADKRNHSNILRYSGELFSEIFKQEGIYIERDYEIGPVPDDSKCVFTYVSEKNVSEAVRLSLLYSSNFIANQLYLCCGRRLHGTPATWKKANDGMKKYLQVRLNLNPEKVEIVDGSGLSTANLISADAMLHILNRFAPYAKLMKKSKGVYLKSGTLTGVYSYAGYFTHADELIPFVLFLNQKKNTRNTVLKRLNNEVKKLLADT